MRGNAWMARVLLAGGVALASAHPVMAQKISLTPNLGVYIPTTELVKAASGEEFKQEMSFTLGGRLGIMLGNRLGLELTGAYAPSDLKVTASGFGDQTADANIFTGSGRVSFHIIPANIFTGSGRVSFHII